MHPQDSTRRGRVPRVCERCGASFGTFPSEIRKGGGRFCTRACYVVTQPGKPVRPLAERFWLKVERGNGCWSWTGNCQHDGYGVIRLLNKTLVAHRVSWELHRGPIPVGLSVLHHCDNRPCVRPDHLYLGTQVENGADMVRRGRSAKGARSPMRLHPESRLYGERNHEAKLTTDDVRDIRQRYETRSALMPTMAREYGVTTTQIWRIVHRMTWKHIA